MKNLHVQISNNTKIGGIILIAMAASSSLISIGPAVGTIQHHFRLSHFSSGLLISIPDLLMGMLALPTPWLVERVGKTKLVIGALLLIAVATFFRISAQNFQTLLLSTVGVGAGIAIAGTLLSGFVKVDFPTRATFMMGIYTTSLSLGSTISSAGGTHVVKTSSWLPEIGVWSIPAIIGFVIWVIITAREKKRLAVRSVKLNVQIPWKNGLAWRLALLFACVNLIFYSLITWAAPLYKEHGLSATSAGYLLGCFVFFFTMASPVFGTLSKSADRRHWLVIASLITILGLLMMAMLPGYLPFPGIAVTAIGLGGAFTLGMTLSQDHTSHVNETNAWTAFILTVGYPIAALGPLTLGALRDVTGSFSEPVLVLVVVSLLMLGLSVTLKPHHSAVLSEKEPAANNLTPTT
jgi:CP family cyanate transporter-like MFS transporter